MGKNNFFENLTFFFFESILKIVKRKMRTALLVSLSCFVITSLAADPKISLGPLIHETPEEEEIGRREFMTDEERCAVVRCNNFDKPFCKYCSKRCEWKEGIMGIGAQCCRKGRSFGC